MATSPLSEKAKSIGQDRPYKDAIDACEAEKGVYSDDRNKGGKPTTAGPGTLPNTPSPFTLKG
ncbi:MAG: hypothetical protein V3W28_01515 [Thermoplasmata archaeon]